jgi:hypothetical protein
MSEEVKITPFQRYISDHTELRVENALKVYRLYDNHVMSEDAAKQAMVLEVEQFIQTAGASHPNFDLFNEIVKANAPVVAEKAAAPVKHVLDVFDNTLAPNDPEWPGADTAVIDDVVEKNLEAKED